MNAAVSHLYILMSMSMSWVKKQSKQGIASHSIPERTIIKPEHSSYRNDN
jgi:hypothetical protein